MTVTPTSLSLSVSAGWVTLRNKQLQKCGAWKPPRLTYSVIPHACQTWTQSSAPCHCQPQGLPGAPSRMPLVVLTGCRDSDQV